ncbi:MAG: tRNA(His) guanylyltransferase Thg1 family protein [Methanothrix sp.]|jgi:tRNA(His) 5'-end guanylyltransferase|nr:tRNA(His) guanylyltransferase Thg1 family protein [Methanothrix sp.]
MKEELGDRIKFYYENRTRYSLPRRTYTLIRLDGVHFHTYTKGLNRPFDDKLINDMDETAKFLCYNIQGAKFAFVQSDEISILVTDFENIKTSPWFEGNIQKISSVSSSMATAKFNELRPNKLAFFDSRVFTITTKVEVENYFIWRQQDTVRNSISSVAQSLYSHKELNGKNISDMQELIYQKGINWNDYSAKYKRGRMIIKEHYLKENTTRSKWSIVEPPIFTKDRKFISDLIPNLL